MFKNLYKNKYNFKHPRLNYSGGVTLVELLVVIFIFVVISSITIFSYGKFNSSLSIKNLADDIALSVRRAQGYAIGVRGFSGSFGEGYGIHLSSNPNTSDLSAGSTKSFILFANLDNDERYDYNSSGTCGNPTASNECLEVLNITSPDKITEIYVENEGQHILSNSGGLDIFFRRPNPEPTFCARNNPISSCDFSTNISLVRIKISTDVDPNIYKTITIFNNGQISVSS